MLTRTLLLVPLFLGLVQGGLQAQAQTDSVVYYVDPSSRLVVKTGKAGLFGFAGHVHVIRANTVSGTLVYRPGQPTSRLSLKVPTESLEVLTPPDTAEIRKVTEAMRTEVLHVDKHPEMIFAADSLDARSGKIRMQLDVTMEGKTRAIPVTADVTIGRDTIRAGGSFVAKQTDFGIEPFRGGPGGTVKVADKVTLCFDLVATRTQADRAGVRHAPEGSDGRTVPGCVDNAEEAARRPM